jgi:hypothetical protein
MFGRVRKHLGTTTLAFRVWECIQEQLLIRWEGGREGQGGCSYMLCLWGSKYTGPTCIRAGLAPDSPLWIQVKRPCDLSHQVPHPPACMILTCGCTCPR